MFTSNSKGIHEFIFDRLAKIHAELLPTNREYQELRKKPAEIINRLYAELPAAELDLLDEYDVSRNLQTDRQNELIYGLGVTDGVLLATWIDQVRQNPTKSLSELGFFTAKEAEENEK